MLLMQSVVMDFHVHLLLLITLRSVHSDCFVFPPSPYGTKTVCTASMRKYTFTEPAWGSLVAKLGKGGSKKKREKPWLAHTVNFSRMYTRILLKNTHVIHSTFHILMLSKNIRAVSAQENTSVLS